MRKSRSVAEVSGLRLLESPLQILEAREEKEGESVVHHLKLKLEHGTMPDQVFQVRSVWFRCLLSWLSRADVYQSAEIIVHMAQVEVVDQPKGYLLRSSQQQR